MLAFRFDPGFGYHVDKTTGIATGNDPESIYAVMSGTHYNGGCCFDYGNSEVNDRDDGCGTMEVSVYTYTYSNAQSDKHCSALPRLDINPTCSLFVWSA